MKWESVIGLEVDVELETKKKMLSAARNSFGATPNNQDCAIE